MSRPPRGKLTLLTLALAATLIGTAHTQAAVLAQYTFASSTDATSDTDPFSTATALTIGVAGTEFGANPADQGYSTGTPVNNAGANASSPTRFVRATQTTTSQAGAISNNDFFGFTLTPNATFEADLTSFTFDYAVSSTSGAALTANFFLRSSVDSFGSNIGGTATVTQPLGSTTSNYSNFSIDLTGATFQNLTSATTFRLYIYNAGNTNASTGWII